MFIRHLTHGLAAAIATTVIASGASAAVRDVQIVRVDFSTSVVTLRNLGAETQPLDSYRLCTADEDQAFLYTTGGLAGVTLEPGDELRIHFNDDAPGGDPLAVNVGGMGPVAQPLDAGPYGLCVYHAIPFTTPANMTDYMQWTDDLSNPGNDSADARAATAMSAGLWIQVNQWVVTFDDTVAIMLDDLSGSLLHGPADYSQVGTPACEGDLDNSGRVDVADLLLVLADWGCTADCVGDADGDGMVTVNDLLVVLASWGPC